MNRLGLIVALVLFGLLWPEPADAAQKRPSSAQRAAAARRAKLKKTQKRKPVARRKAARKPAPAKRLAPAQPVVSTPPPSPEPSGTLVEAYSYLGLPYRRGGSSPVTGFDCSGLVQYVFRTTTGIDLPRSAMQQFQVGMKLEKDQLQPADLVFFRSPRGWHVGIYTGDGNFIHSPNSRDRVKVTALSAPYYTKSYLGARRIFQPMPLPEPPAELPEVDELPPPSELVEVGSSEDSPL